MRWVSFVAILLWLSGAFFWTWHVYLRALDPAAFAHRGLHPNWLAGAYFILTQMGLVAFGLALKRIGYPRWVGRMNVIAGVTSMVLLAVFGDLPPFVYYIITGTTAFVLLGRPSVPLIAV